MTNNLDSLAGKLLIPSFITDLRYLRFPNENPNVLMDLIPKATESIIE